MICAIDTTPASGFEIACVYDGRITISRSVGEPFQESEQLIPLIKQMIAEQKKEMSYIKEVWVVKGPGRFTAVRIGVACANALAYALGVPLRAIERQSPDETLSNMVVRFLHSKCEDCIEPVYGKEPNSTHVV